MSAISIRLAISHTRWRERWIQNARTWTDPDSRREAVRLARLENHLLVRVLRAESAPAARDAHLGADR